MKVRNLPAMNYQEIARNVVESSSDALKLLANNLPGDFSAVVKKILSIKGRVVLVGMGKSGNIARKIASSLASTGTPSLFVHPGEASHGDLGMITESDIVIMLSNSGETKELFDTINYCKRYNIPIVGMTMKQNSTLAASSNFIFLIPHYNEASSISAPTTSSLIMLALGDALVVALHEAKGISKDDYRIFHPGGKIGANLLRVSQLMYKDDKIPGVPAKTPFAEFVVTMTGGGLGCVVVMENKKLVGIITDGDLRRHINSDLKNMVASDIMTANPLSVAENTLAGEALFIMNSKSITHLPITRNNEVVGIIHIHDLLRAGVG